MSTDLAQRVGDALAYAADNGYDFKGQTAYEIAQDLATYDAGLEDVDLDTLEGAIRQCPGFEY